ncbi:MAG: hypothetical protein ACP5SD_01825 [Elusimicrobiales bacterium]|jgi:3-deoxy-7-phosphoheptulonate synthase|nr:hypothetical protein [Elusimicrobiales bacterium]HOL62791.1 hypothetical protein [Elusimicrobiales bacterium]HPO95840.1 hypothetical protein [Elusimicrobiales bacterium]
MKIFFKGDRTKTKKELREIFRKAEIVSVSNDCFEIKKIKPGVIYNLIPKTENIKNVKKVVAENRELCPLAYKKNYYFKSPINTAQKFVIAGPCVIRDFDEFEKEVFELEKMGIDAIRAPLFKPRSSPYGWEGYGTQGIKKLKEIKRNAKKPFVGELLDYRLIEKTDEVFDIIQIGARNMKNYVLLKEIGMAKKPVLLKRQPKSSFKELLYSAEYLLKYGAKKIIICERGDNLSDGISSINIDIIKKIKNEIKIPVVSDLSHSAKDREKINLFLNKTKEISDGFMIETSLNPELSPTDTKQIISLKELKNLIEKIK